MNRERFPGVKDWARLDGPAGTQMVDVAIDAMAEFMRSGKNANSHGNFQAAHDTDATTDDARAAVAELLGVGPGPKPNLGVGPGPKPNSVVFGPSMTALTMRFAAALPLQPGDEVVCTRLDHDANVRPWVIAAERAGATVIFADPTETLDLPASAVEAVLTDKTRWVAVTAASNACGAVPDLDGITAAAHAAGARVYVDAVAAAPHRYMDASRFDVLACSAYKWFGPHIGVLTAKAELLDELHPPKLIPSPDEVPDRFELGTLPFESLAGVAAAARYVHGLGWDAVRAHEDALLQRTVNGLEEIDGVTLYGAPADRTPTVMFNVAGHTSAEVARHCAEHQVAVWDGNYYAHELEQHLGLAPDGAIRAGFVHYNDESDADRLVDAIARL